MGNYLSGPILLLAAMLQATFVPQIRVLGGGPDLVFLLVMAWAIHAELEESVVWVFVGGITLDLFSAAPVGSSVVGMLIMVFGINLISRQIYGVSLLLILGATLVGSVLQQGSIAVILLASGFKIDFAANFGYVIVPTLAYNLVAIWPTYWFVRQIQRRIMVERRMFA